MTDLLGVDRRLELDRCRARGGRMPELLAPAGSLDAALAALAAGADAVYLGLGAFDARAAAPGLTLAELAAVCALAHGGAGDRDGHLAVGDGTPMGDGGPADGSALAGNAAIDNAAGTAAGSAAVAAGDSAAAPRAARRPARIYVTLNALATTDELPRMVDLAARARAAGADAFIVADLGVARRLAHELPGVELHLSTQAAAQSPAAVRLAARELGVARVTVARELSVAEIAACCATGVEVEVFCHGAICIGYSGACAFSALTRGRSAMRGDCTQPCRHPWELRDGDDHPCGRVPGNKLLCPKDFLGIRLLPELVRTGVGALKIEGRMKNPDYVYNVVGAYRAALDAIAAGVPYDADALVRRLGRSFNRGFTEAYLRGGRAGTGRALMSFERACNQGVPVGEVVARGHHMVTVELTGDVAAGDTLEIHTVLPADAGPDVPRRWPLVPCPVDGAAGARIAVPCKRRVEPGSAVYLTASASTRAAAAAAVEELRAMLPAAPNAPAASASTPCAGPAPSVPTAPEPRRAPVRRPLLGGTPDQVRVALAAGLGAEVVVPAWRIMEDPDAWEALVPEVTVLLDEVCRAADLPRTKRLVGAARRVICRNLAQIPLAREARAAFDVAAPIAVENRAAARVVASWGARRIWLPDELPDEQASQLAGIAASAEGDTVTAADTVGAAAPGAAGGTGTAANAGAQHGAGPIASDRPVPIARLDLGMRELMVTEHCLLTTEGPCDGRCASCRRRTERRYLADAAGRRYPIWVDALGRSRIFQDGAEPPADDRGDDPR